MAFEDGTREPVDAIVYATGYKTTFPFLDPSVFTVADARPPALYRRIVALDHPNLMFAGLLQPIGPTIPLVESQARWIAAVLSGRLPLPSRAEMAAEVERHRAHAAKRYLNAARYTLEVDARAYSAEMKSDLKKASETAPARSPAQSPAAVPVPADAK